MSSFTKIIVAGLALYVATQILAGDLLPSGPSLPSHLDYLSTIATEDNKKIVVLLSGNEWNGPCTMLENDVISTWDWSKFSRDEIVFEQFDYAFDGQTSSLNMRKLYQKFGDHGFPTFLVSDAEGHILGQQSGYHGEGPFKLMDWIRSL